MQVSHDNNTDDSSTYCVDVGEDDIDRESWMYRSTQDAASIGRLDHEDWTWEDEDQEEIRLSTPPAKLSLVKDVKDDTMCKKMVSPVLEKQSPQQMTARAGQWTTCVTPILVTPQEKIADTSHQAFVSLRWVLCTLAGNAASLFTATYVSNDLLRQVLPLTAFPKCTIVLLTYMLFGFVSFCGGISGDLATHRLHIVQRGIWLWCAAAIILLLASHPDVALPGLYIVGVFIAVISAGCVGVNVAILGCPNEDAIVSHKRVNYFTQCGAVQIAAVLVTQSFFSSIPVAVLQPIWRPSPLEYLALALSLVFFISTLIGFHLATYNRFLKTGPNLASLSVYLAAITPLWKILLTGFLFMVLGSMLCVVGLFYSNGPSYYGTRFFHSMVGVSFVTIGWVWCILISVAMSNPSGALNQYFSSTTSTQNSHMNKVIGCIVPCACLSVFAAFVRGQLFTLFILQACQCDMDVIGAIYDPEFTGVLVQSITLVITPLVTRFGAKAPQSYVHGILLTLLASFLSSIMELYRRISGSSKNQHLNPYTCHKTASSFSVLFTIPQMILLGLSDSFMQTSAIASVYTCCPPSMKGSVLGLLSFCDGIGYTAAMGLGVLVSHWYEEPQPADLVLLFLLVTSLGCMAFACMKRLLLLHKAHAIWP